MGKNEMKYEKNNIKKTIRYSFAAHSLNVNPEYL